ncbi:unnamed protein product [Didymodactylos carnosus]|uniref:Uncharacterized protein n=1 Tax=Didymodactylos carnosus TaxID=1234261 RepID=A0A813SF49_9BILA|nr:unnamed protein product [Didymodactylos carnosus]CAF1111976.1 unnamed protein product [Didymodactylos carnosus]CAF3580783.1 unnamed protein product [Didymodactylos carnosus]CAF3880254.1 unnamed protein product [Didymodactylos carnosus]
MATTANNNDMCTKLSETTITTSSSNNILSSSSPVSTTLQKLPHLLETTTTTDNEFHRASQQSYSHSVFVDSLRDWRDPLLHGSEPIEIPLCPRCSACKCRSLLNRPTVNTSHPRRIYQYEDIHHDHLHHNHSHHHPSCPSYKSKSYSPVNRNRSRSRSSGRTFSHDSSIRLNSDQSMSTSSSPKDRAKSLSTIVKSKIPVRSLTGVFNSTKTTRSNSNIQTSDRAKKTLIPRPIVNKNNFKNQLKEQPQQTEKVDDQIIPIENVISLDVPVYDAKIDENKDVEEKHSSDFDPDR